MNNMYERCDVRLEPDLRDVYPVKHYRPETALAGLASEDSTGVAP